MSCSNDSGCSLHLVDQQGRKDGIVFAVRKGVASFDYSRELNVIGTITLSVCVCVHLSLSYLFHTHQLLVVWTES